MASKTMYGTDSLTFYNEDAAGVWLSVEAGTITSTGSLYANGTLDIVAELNNKQNSLTSSTDLNVADITCKSLTIDSNSSYDTLAFSEGFASIAYNTVDNKLHFANETDTILELSTSGGVDAKAHDIVTTGDVTADVLNINSIQTDGTEITINDKINMGANQITTSGIFNSSNSILTTGDMVCSSLLANDTITGDNLIISELVSIPDDSLTIANTAGLQDALDDIQPLTSVNNLYSTGLISGGSLFHGATHFSVSAGSAIHVDPTTRALTEFSWALQSAISVTNIATQLITFVSINQYGVVIQSSDKPTESERRGIVFLGVVVHVNNTTVNTVNQEQQYINNPANQLEDLYETIGFMNLGNELSANSSDLRFIKAIGYMCGFGLNMHNDDTNPNKLTLPYYQSSLIQFQYRMQNGTNITPDTNDIDPDNYDLNGVLTAVPNNKFTIQHIYTFTSAAVKIQPGQYLYSSLALAKESYLFESFTVEPSILANGMFLGHLIVKKGCTDLTDTAEALFINSGKFENGGSVSTGGGTLQSAYDNSVVAPHIEIGTSTGAFQLKGNSAVTNALSILDDSDVEKCTISKSGILTCEDITIDDDLVHTDRTNAAITIGGLAENSGFRIKDNIFCDTQTNSVRCIIMGDNGSFGIHINDDATTKPFLSFGENGVANQQCKIEYNHNNNRLNFFTEGDMSNTKLYLSSLYADFEQQIRGNNGLLLQGSLGLTVTSGGDIVNSSGNVRCDGGDIECANGTMTTKDLIVDGSLIYTDSLNNRVGINTTSAESSLQIVGARQNTPTTEGIHCGSSGSSYGIDICSSSGSGNIDFTTVSQNRRGSVGFNDTDDSMYLSLFSSNKLVCGNTITQINPNNVSDGQCIVGGSTSGGNCFSVVGTKADDSPPIPGVHMNLTSGTTPRIEMCASTSTGLSELHFTTINVNKYGNIQYNNNQQKFIFQSNAHTNVIFAETLTDFTDTNVVTTGTLKGNLDSTRGQLLIDSAECNTELTVGTFSFRQGANDRSNTAYGFNFPCSVKMKKFVYSGDTTGTAFSTSTKLVWQGYQNGNSINVFVIADFSLTASSQTVLRMCKNKFSSSGTSQIDTEYVLSDTGFGAMISWKCITENANSDNIGHRLSITVETQDDL